MEYRAAWISYNVFSLETGGNNIVERLVATITNIPLSKIKQGNGLNDDEVSSVMSAIDQIKNVIL